MSQIKKILYSSNEKTINGETRCIINDFPNFPSTDKNLDYLFILMSVQSIIFKEEEISFPTKIDKWSVDISPTDNNITNNLFSYEGVKKVVKEFTKNLKEEKIFVKFQILFENINLPTIRIYFFKFSEKGEYKITNESFLYPFIFFVYDEDTFNKERIQKMEDVGMNTKFIQTLPMINICPVKYDNNGEIIILDELERYENEW
jgi:hypothetical protein